MMDKNIYISGVDSRDQAMIDRTHQGIIRSSLPLENVLKSYDKASLDPSLIDRMWWIPLNKMATECHKPYYQRTIRELLADIGVADTHGMCNGDDPQIIVDMFKGVNKALPLPVLLIPCKDAINVGQVECKTSYVYDGVLTTQFAVCFPEKVYKVNPKNLVKHLGYDLASAKALAKNINSCNNITMFVPSLPKDTWLVLKDNVNNNLIWSPHKKLGYSFESEFIDCKSIVTYVEQMEVDLPISNLQLWKEIAADTYARENEGGDFFSLSVESQKRRLVNTIRHCSLYEQIYTFVAPERQDYAHDLCKEKILRKISATFPYLAGEVTRQLNAE